jgi:hypothetical protein
VTWKQCSQNWKELSVSEQGYGLVPELSYENNLVRNEVWIMIFLDWAEFRNGKSFNSVLPFWAESISDWRWFWKSQLNETGADSGKTINMKVVYNFETFP